MTSYCFYLPHTFRPIPGDIDSASGKGNPRFSCFASTDRSFGGIVHFRTERMELVQDLNPSLKNVEIPFKGTSKQIPMARHMTTLRHFTPCPSDLTFEGDTLFSFTFSVSLRGSCGKPGLHNRGNIRWQITINHPFVYSGSWMNWDGLR